MTYGTTSVIPFWGFIEVIPFVIPSVTPLGWQRDVLLGLSDSRVIPGIEPPVTLLSAPHRAFCGQASKYATALVGRLKRAAVSAESQSSHLGPSDCLDPLITRPGCALYRRGCRRFPRRRFADPSLVLLKVKSRVNRSAQREDHVDPPGRRSTPPTGQPYRSAQCRHLA